MMKVKNEWSKSYPVRPRDCLKVDSQTNNNFRFKASYENERTPATISSLIGWEYSRKWLEEKDKFMEKSRMKPKRFTNDYQAWLEKRKPRENESCKPHGLKKLLVVTEESRKSQ